MSEMTKVYIVVALFIIALTLMAAITAVVIWVLDTQFGFPLPIRLAPVLVVIIMSWHIQAVLIKVRELKRAATRTPMVIQLSNEGQN